MATLIDAVNTLLIARGLVPVNTLQIGHPSVAAATNIIKRHSDIVQSKSWWFNTEYGVQFIPDATDGRIRLPGDIARLDGVPYTILNGYLYDIVNRTTVFTENPSECICIYMRDLEFLPTVPFRYIEALAKEEFIRSMESALLTTQAKRDIDTMFAMMQIADLQAKDVTTQTNPLMSKWKQKMKTR